MRKVSVQWIVLGGLLGLGTLASFRSLGAPGTVPVVKPRPTAQPTPSFRLPANAKKVTAKFAPNIPNAPRTSVVPGKPWLVRAYSKHCIVGSDCLIYGSSLGTRAAGQKSPAGLHLSFYETGTVGDIKLEPTAWTPGLVGFKAPATMHAGRRYVVLIRDALGKAASNGVEVAIAALPDYNKYPSGDFDDDGAAAIERGGLDCDDLDKIRTPGRTEIADPNDIDEDCEPATFGRRDNDGDGVQDGAACNVSITGSGLDRSPIWSCGTDCDDTKAAMKPGELRCDDRDPDLIFECTTKTSWPVDPRGFSGEGFYRPYSCSSFVPGSRCVPQPNGRGVCQ
jgi:hypothetical protein